MVACGDDETTKADGGSASGGLDATESTGGASTGGVGAEPGSGTGGWATGGRLDGGGAIPSGGFAPTGGFAPGGAATGGLVATGGAATGGAATGGVATGGVATGGTSLGGAPPGGSTTGGSISGVATGGVATAGESTGGMSAGARGPCDSSDPPADVAAWVEESWNAQLGNNIRSRQAWLLDNAIMGDGQINLCVRWGATSPPPEEVKSEVGPSVEGWLNDWFHALGDYGCFPYADGIHVTVTGWAVRPGNESWVADLGPEIAVYTETDGDGEPKCPDACSFFTNWEHEFPNCPGGERFHTDYWIWVSDQLPGGGAAAVGGDWGLRMPVASFVDRLGREGDSVIEHEMGHGFGFQDYYDWTGSRPAGGSLMIVGSANQGTPTLGDTWLVRRTWREMQDLRGW